jgi:hypothetical protein
MKDKRCKAEYGFTATEWSLSRVAPLVAAKTIKAGKFPRKMRSARLDVHKAFRHFCRRLNVSLDAQSSHYNKHKVERFLLKKNCNIINSRQLSRGPASLSDDDWQSPIVQISFRFRLDMM